MKEIKMQSIIWEVILYLVWLWLLMMMAYGNKDGWSYWLNSSYRNTFERGAYTDALMDTYHMKKVSLCMELLEK